MNKHFIPKILRFLLLIATTFFWGCTQSTAIDSPSAQTPISNNAVETVTETSCVSSSQTTTSEFMKEADEWFLSSISQIPSRDQYSAWKEWENNLETICGNYQTAILNNESWVHNPINLALRTFTFSEYFLPDSVIAVAMPERNTVTFQNQRFETDMEHNVVTVVYSIFHPNISELEIRVDLITENKNWQIRWIGSRWKCFKNNDNNWSTEPCS